MSFMYGVDFEAYRGIAYLMIVAGGVSAAIDFLYAILSLIHICKPQRHFAIVIPMDAQRAAGRTQGAQTVENLPPAE